MNAGQDNSKESWWGFFWVALGVFAVQVFGGMAIYSSFRDDPTGRGTFGDMFGAINTLFSGLAFAGVVYAIVLQKRELSLQRQELTLTRMELEKSAAAQLHSAHLMNEQLQLQLKQFEPLLIAELDETNSVENCLREAKFRIINEGQSAAYNLQLLPGAFMENQFPDGIDVFQSQSVLHPKETWNCNLSCDASDIVSERIEFHCMFTSAMGQSYSVPMSLSVDQIYVGHLKLTAFRDFGEFTPM